MPEPADHTIIIGGGVIGLSVAYHLGKLGAERVLLLERNELTGGTSWHAAGIVGPLRASRHLTALAEYAVELFPALEAETGQALGYKTTGGFFLAQRPERLIELRRLQAIGEMHGLRTEMMTPAQVAARFACIHTRDLAGALWVEKDGQINPVDLCMAYAKGAKAAGVEIREHAGVAELVVNRKRPHRRRVEAVVLDTGERIDCATVVNCAGLWAREVANLAAVAAPLQAVEHCYAVTEPVPELPQPFPVVRDLDSGIYLKEDVGRLVFGAFEAGAKVWHHHGVDPRQSFLTLEDDMEHAAPMMAAAINRIPALRTAGLQRFMTGPESFTPDTLPLIGRAPEADNFFVAAGFNSTGILSSAGVGKALADWIVRGAPRADMTETDIARFDALDNDAAFLAARSPEAVHNQFAMHWPFKQFQTGRGRRRSVWHAQLADAGAVFGEVGGWERPLWFAQPGEARSIDPSHARQNWWPCAEREAKMLARSGALFDLSPFAKWSVCGADAARVLQNLCSNDIAVEPGGVVHTLMLNADAGIEAELTVTRLSAQRFLLVSAAANRARDRRWIARHLPASCDVAVTDVTGQFAVAGLMGPASRECMAHLFAEGAACFSDEAFPFARSKPLDFRGADIRASRLSFAGELGWELYIPVEVAPDFYAHLARAMAAFDVGHAGLFCLDACRLEKGYPHWGDDMGPRDSPLQANLMSAVKLRKAEFIGRQALLAHQQRRPDRQLLLFEVQAERPLLLRDEPVYRDGRPVGATTSGGLGFRTGKALSFASIRADGLSRAQLLGASYEISIAGERFGLRPLETAPYDPQGKKMKGAAGGRRGA